MDFKKLEDLIKGLVTEKTTPEEAEKIAEVNRELGSVKAEMVKFAEDHETLREKYVKALMNSTFKEEPEDEKEEPQPKTLDQIAEEYAKAQKGN